MKTTSFVTNGFYDLRTYENFIQKIKETGSDNVTAICLSRKFYAGLPVTDSIESRIAKLHQAGAKRVILLPEETDLFDEESRIIAVSSFFLKNRDIDELILPFEGIDEDSMIMDISNLLMKVNYPYDQLKDHLEGAGEFLSYPNNVWNMRLFHNIRIYYNPVKPMVIHHALPTEALPALSPEMDRLLFDQLVDSLKDVPARLLRTHLDDIMHGNEKRTSLLLDTLFSSDLSALEIHCEPSFTSLSQIMTAADFSEEAARCYLLMVINNYRMIDNTVGALHGYVEHIEEK